MKKTLVAKAIGITTAKVIAKPFKHAGLKALNIVADTYEDVESNIVRKQRAKEEAKAEKAQKDFSEVQKAFKVS